MKHALLFIALIGFLHSGISAQNLAFNSVKLITTVQTVPVNKVWKVEAAFGADMRSSCSTAALHQIQVNGSNVTVTQATNLAFAGVCGGWSGIATVTRFPFWLPAGATLAAASNVSSISVIEFDIVP
jgi:hypothetical protein